MSLGKLCICWMVCVQSALAYDKIPDMFFPEDITTIKQREMIDTTVLILTQKGSGSGTLIDRIKTDEEDVFEYRVLTNAHVTQSRLSEYLVWVDSITGRVRKGVKDTGCFVIVFNNTENDWHRFSTKIVLENLPYDLAVLSFSSEMRLDSAKIATEDISQQIRVFDEVFAIGCQLGNAPSPTVGIISQIIKGDNGEIEWMVYINSAQITPGSSGGGLYKKDADHYYLIGVPYRIALAPNGQLVPHLAQAISITTVKQLIDADMEP